MVKPEDIPERIPEMDVVKPEDERVMTELLASVKKANGGQYPFLFAREEDELARRDLAYKFLKARRWKLKDAEKMVSSTIQFRKEYGLDSWRLFPCAFPLLGYDEEDILNTIGVVPDAAVPLDGRPTPTEWDMCYRALQASYVNVYHYWDKEGHPVLYDCCGRASVSSILSRLERATPVGKGLKDVIVPYHTYMNEVQYYLIRYANAKAKAGTPLGTSPSPPPPSTDEEATPPVPEREPKKVMGTTVVMNAEGLHLGMLQKRFINVVRDIFAVDQSYYPEVLHRLFVINCPALVHTAYSLVKGALDENTRKKLVFCSKAESLAVLRRVIDDDKIPQELGGGCRCEGGCLPLYKDAETDGSVACAAAEVPTENITIKAGHTLSRSVPLRAGEEVSWQFALENADVYFSARFTSSLNPDSTDAGAAGTDTTPSPVEADGKSAGKGRKKHVGSTEKTSKHSDPSSAEAPAVEVKKKEKLSADVDAFTASEDGVLHLLWDNSSSWVTGKKLQLRVVHGSIE